MKRGSLLYSIDEIDMAGSFLYNRLLDHKIIAFIGTLGAGKTTLIQAILYEAGIRDTMQSPTFSYVQSYVNSAGHTFHHFDLYRIDRHQQFIEYGFADYLTEADAFLLIEWPEIIRPLLPAKTYWVAIDTVSETTRCIRYEIA